VIDAVDAVAAANDVASLTGAALRCRGLREDDPVVLRAAVAAYADSPRPVEHARRVRRQASRCAQVTPQALWRAWTMR
jgi:hypothetical protein